MTCSVEVCDRPTIHGRLMCSAHTTREYRGDVLAHVPVKESRGRLFQPRLPLAPLRALARSNVQLAAWLGIGPRQVDRWRTQGVPINSAEKACDTLGVHPTELWGDEYGFVAMCPLALVAAQVRG